MAESHRSRKQVILPAVIGAFRSGNVLENLQKILESTDLPFGAPCAAAIRRSLILSALGLPLEDGGAKMQLDDAIAAMENRKNPQMPPLTVMGCACHRCRGGTMRVTDLCQNCVAKPCMAACRFGAISPAEGGRSAIDEKICKKCGICAKACPYGAIAKTIAPCERACPVGAMGKDKMGFASIDYEKCIYCGKCMAACPFEAIQVRSQLLDVLREMRDGKSVIAFAAPAAFGQFSCSAEQLHRALKKVGFSSVYEVATGAEETSIEEAEEWAERMKNGQKFMTSSCCAAYNILVKKHIPELVPFVSHTKTPLYYTAARARKECADGIFVFISPCIAKYEEVHANENVQFTITSEELAALFEAREVNPAAEEPEKFSIDTAKEAREFALSGGVSRAIGALSTGSEPLFVPIDGIDGESTKELRTYAREGICEKGNMIEVMSCPGGCVGGCGNCRSISMAQRQIKGYASEGEAIRDKYSKDS
ncbi:MAG: 4Fe-4S binding protein [Puniceicoccales bacterium]|jgi:[FeFe] hydrogenase (group B1/B3)|nr:4Fe-4S binding protein [Puniceicoccales bacterium]